MAKTINKGDRVAYSGNFLNQTSQHTGVIPQRRGTFLRAAFENYGRVRWDDEAELIASGRGQYADKEYCDNVIANGSLVSLGALAVVGSREMGAN